MFQIKDGIVSLNKTRKLSPKQLAMLKQCQSDYDKQRYVMSLMGVIKGRVSVPRIKRGYTDQLAIKQKGSIFELMQELRNVGKNHVPSPKDLGQWIGVEIECFIPSDCSSCGECDACCDGDPCDNRTDDEDEAHSRLRKALKRVGMARTCVKYDASLIDEEGIGVEVTLLFNSKHGFEPLERLCKALNAHGCYINKTCGLHVHMDSRHLTRRQVKKMGASIGYALPVIKWLVPKSRHDNTYCKLKVSQLRGDRYAAVNLTAFSKYKTIEIRLHQGSINAKKIKNWIELMKFLGQANLKTDIASFQDLIDLGLSDELVEYCESRITELNPEAWPRLMPAESSQWPRITVLTHLQGQGEDLTTQARVGA